MNSGQREDVARRAYELFLSRGGQHGRDLDDWLEAERQLTVTRVTPLVPRGPHTNGRTTRTRARQRAR